MTLNNAVHEIKRYRPHATEYTVLALLRLNYGIDPHPMDLKNAMKGKP